MITKKNTKIRINKKEKKKMEDRKALELIASYAYDDDIKMEIRLHMITQILRDMGMDYSSSEFCDCETCERRAV